MPIVPSLRMTPAAESLVQLGKRVFQDVRETLSVITDRTRELRGTLRLSGGMTVESDRIGTKWRPSSVEHASANPSVASSAQANSNPAW